MNTCSHTFILPSLRQQVSKHVDRPHIFLAAVIEAIKPVWYEAFSSCARLQLWSRGRCCCRGGSVGRMRPTLQPLLHQGGGTSLTFHHLILHCFHITLQVCRHNLGQLATPRMFDRLLQVLMLVGSIRTNTCMLQPFILQVYVSIRSTHP